MTAALTSRRQWIIYRTAPSVTRPGKTDKLPVDPHTGYGCNAHDPAAWVSHAEAVAAASRYGLGLAFVITAADPLFCLDIDGCLQPDNTWSPLALSLCATFPGAMVEVSQSGTGLHIWGTYAGEAPPHKTRGRGCPPGVELYTEQRFMAMGSQPQGDPGTDCTAALAGLVAQYYARDPEQRGSADWTDGPCEGSRPIADDGDLVRRACSSRQSMRGVLSGRASFADLWEGNADALQRAFPDGGGQARAWDCSAADAALAQHLAFWTGNDCERIERLMQQSALVRDKWEARPDYVRMTITTACSRQRQWYVEPVPTAAAPGVLVPAAPGEGFAVPGLPSPFADARDGTATTRPLTELGNALRLHDRHGADVRHVPDAGGAWVIWRDGAWLWDTDGAAVRSLAAGLAPGIYTEGAANLYEGDKFAKWARQSQQAGTIRAAVGLLGDVAGVRVSLAALDGDPMLVGVNSARDVIDLRTGATRPAEREDYVTKSLHVSEQGRADGCPRWLAFLGEVFQHDAELINWVQRWCGYLLSGDTREHFFVFAYGFGRNGKGTFAETLKGILGDYARSVSSETLTDTKRAAGGASPDLAALIGARMALTSETEEGTALAENLVKTLTGGDTISVRQLYAPPVDFKPQFKLLVLGNHKPVVKGADYGIWSRVRLVPFTRVFAEHERDPALGIKLVAEAPHILAWMVAGCLEWQRRGLADVPAAVRAATEEYRSEMDLVGRFLDEQCHTGPAYEADGRMLYAGYKLWAMENGLRPQTSASFGRRLVERGLPQRKSHGVRVWQGVALRMAGGGVTDGGGVGVTERSLCAPHPPLDSRPREAVPMSIFRGRTGAGALAANEP